MADSPWQALTAPFRLAATSLHATAGKLAELGGDEGFQRLIASLDKLPEAATFEALSSTSQWQVELPQTTDQPQQPPRPENRFIERISQRARRQGQLAVIEKAAPSERPQAPSPGKPSPSTLAAGAERRQDPIVNETGRHYQPLPSERSGSWIVIEQIANLTRQLEQQPKSVEASSASDGIAKHKRARTNSGKTPAVNRAPSRPAEATIKSPRAAGNSDTLTAAAKQTPPGANPPHPTEAGLALLADYLTQLWPSRESAQADKAPPDQGLPATQASRQAEPAPAPRAPSLLQPGASGEPGGRDAPPGKTSGSGKPIGNGQQETIKPQNTRHDAPSREWRDDDLEARLNRALIEQAWLRGVDLT